MPSLRVAAGWVLPVLGPPIRDGAVLLDEDGVIRAVGPEAGLPHPPGVPEVRIPGGIVLPGLVNAHTHLELTGMAGAVRSDDFPGWIRGIRAAKAARSRPDFLAAARQGVRDGWAEGVTCVADTGDTGTVIEALAELGGRGTCYHEVFGPHPDQCAESLAGLAARVAELRRFTSARVRLGVSPHAPYTVSGPLYQAVAGWARGEGLPLALHLAEAPEERTLFVGATGGFAEMWAGRGIPLPPQPGASPVEHVDRCGVLGTDTLCIHVVQVDEYDLALLAARGVGVAHCPLSNRAHAHGTAPLRRMLDLELRVGVGTDSVVSVGRLDLRGEARAARQIGGLTDREAVALMTLDAARAIGWGDRVGALAPGRLGDLALLRTGATDRPEAAALAEEARVVATYVEGREVFHRKDWHSSEETPGA